MEKEKTLSFGNARSLLCLYPSIIKKIEQLEDSIKKKAHKSKSHISPAELLCNEIIDEVYRCDGLRVLKNAIDEVLARFDEVEMHYFKVSYFRKKPSSDYVLDPGRLLSLTHKFALYCCYRGLDDVWFNDVALKTYNEGISRSKRTTVRLSDYY